MQSLWVQVLTAVGVMGIVVLYSAQYCRQSILLIIYRKTLARYTKHDSSRAILRHIL